jgi:hypothetical protein
VPVNDGAGLLDGKDTFTPKKPFFTPPIQKEAADRIEQLEKAIREACDMLSETDSRSASIAMKILSETGVC